VVWNTATKILQCVIIVYAGEGQFDEAAHAL
jgi:hypothetical protein